MRDEELSLSFELPDYAPWNDRFLRDLVPLQMCRTVIDAVTSAMGADTPRIRQKIESSNDRRRASTASREVIRLPEIGKWLPGNWADAEIADKAVKSDNAPVDFRPWHRRIQLVLPCSVDSLGCLERFFMKGWRLTVIRSLLQFMAAMYGKDWCTLGIRGAGKRRFREPSLSSSKRRGVSSESSMGGGVSEDENEFSAGDTTLHDVPGLVSELPRLHQGFTGSGSGHNVNLVGMDVWISSTILAMEWA